MSCCMHKSLTQISRIIMLCVLDGDSLSQYRENNKGSIQHYHWETGAQTVKWEHQKPHSPRPLIQQLAQFSRRGNLLRQFSVRMGPIPEKIAAKTSVLRIISVLNLSVLKFDQSDIIILENLSFEYLFGFCISGC